MTLLTLMGPSVKTEIRLGEWGKADPRSVPALGGVSFDGAPSAREIANRLTEQGILICTETREGLALQTTSYVGSLDLGAVRVVIEPKIRGSRLLTLMRFAFGLRDVRLFEASNAQLAVLSFQDLLIYQLVQEVEELLARGLRRQYIPRKDSLASPRGRIAFQELAQQGGLRQARIPCRFEERSPNHLVNQVVCSGLDLAATLASDGPLRMRAHRLAAELSDGVDGAPLVPSTFRALRRQANRLTVAYEPALRLTSLLSQNLGATVQDGRESAKLPGFLFDMNRFFEDLVTKYLRRNLVGAVVQAQASLAGVFEYETAHNPRGRRAPRLRPDILIIQGGQVVAVLDAKYRDLYAQDLPREMLYQLTVYALSQESHKKATILYPTMNETAREARLAVRDPSTGTRRGEVVLRPVLLGRLAELLGQRRSPSVALARAEFARGLAFGLPG